jgi:hypothetical protein
MERWRWAPELLFKPAADGFQPMVIMHMPCRKREHDLSAGVWLHSGALLRTGGYYVLVVVAGGFVVVMCGQCHKGTPAWI